MFDVVVFGATGFTGKFVVEQLLSSGVGGVAVAGRDASRLAAFGLPVIVADVNNSASLLAMCSQTRVLLNCVGPYRFYGDAVVKACVAGRAHYLDISGEPEFIETVAAAYDAAARAANITIVSACGFDSVPADIGTLFACKALPPGVTPVDVESYFALHSGPEGFAIHYATYECAVHGFGARDELAALRKSQKSAHTTVSRPPIALPRRGALHYDRRMGRYAIPFPGADASIVRRSQRAIHTQDSTPFVIDYGAYVVLSSVVWVAVIVVVGAVFSALARFTWGRACLLRFPGFFSLGRVSHAGPTVKQLQSCSFTMSLFVRGQDSEGQQCEAHCEVSGAEPGYVATPKIMIECARMLLTQRSKIPAGVHTTATAFRDTPIVNALQTHDAVAFKCLGVRDITPRVSGATPRS